MSQSIRTCRACGSDKNWNYCCKMNIKQYISDLEHQINSWKYSQNNNDHELMSLRAQVQFSTLNLKHESMKSFIFGFGLAYITLNIIWLFQ